MVNIATKKLSSAIAKPVPREPGALPHALASVEAKLAPLWPLADYVAVNPFLGFSTQPFLSAQATLQKVRSGELLMPLDYYRDLIAAGSITADDVDRAAHLCRHEYPQWYSKSAQDQKRTLIQEGHHGTDQSSSRTVFRTFAEAIDDVNGSTWARTIVDEVSRHCAAHYDKGQAVWASPWKHLNLYAAWHRLVTVNRRLELLGVRGSRQWFANLPSSPRQAIAYLLEELRVPSNYWSEFLLCQLMSVVGWASYVKHRVRSASLIGQFDEDLIGLLAIRLAYDGSLVAAGLASQELQPWPEHLTSEEMANAISQPHSATLTRYLLQVATEIAYRRKLCAQLQKSATPIGANTSRPFAQMVFCIDVRSERMRRNLEATCGGIQTCGFAGFFGVALEYIPLGATSGSAQCPVLLTPSFHVRETLRNALPGEIAQAIEDRRSLRIGRMIWKSFQSSAASCFSFVESCGLLYINKLLSNTFAHAPPVKSAEFDGIDACQRHNLGPVMQQSVESGLEDTRRVDLAQALLTNLGLTRNLSRLVVFCGHESAVSNNPLKASLDCGACGGHSGLVNARVAADLLNDPIVRIGLQKRGIEISHEVWFVAAVHNTTTDNIRFADTESIPQTHAADLQQLQELANEAGYKCRSERAPQLGTQASKLRRRSTDWSEVRPEWGLAGNAAFIVAPRTRTLGRNLDGRTFLHDYDFQKDPNLRVLELIMTAPMIVTSWINLQYYASAVDNQAFGSGNKVLHNVVGRLGILEGNGGDLMTGLPWQSLHDGHKFRHHPLRLLVVIEAPRDSIRSILEKHASVRDLVVHGWLRLAAIDDNKWFQYQIDDSWQEIPT
jgi:uncharacterized protein